MRHIQFGKIVNVGKNEESNGKTKNGYIPTYNCENKKSGESSRMDSLANELLSLLSCHVGDGSIDVTS